MNHGLLWLGRKRRFLQAAACVVLAATLLVSCSGVSSGASGDWTFRYLPENFLFLLASMLLALGVAGSVVTLATRRRWASLPAIVVGSLVLFAMLPPRSPFHDGALSRACMEGAGCFVLSRAPVVTDTVYDLWHEPGSDSLIWRRFVPENRLNYSEDGSYVDDPQLVLSGNRSILALRRGGYFFDAIDVGSRSVVSPFFNHTQSEADLADHSSAIAALLERNR